jgi:GTP pyrophosphokinase
MVSTASNLPNGTSAGEPEIGVWLRSLSPHYGEKDNQRLRDAFQLAAEVLPQTPLETGETPLRHNLAAADILAHLKLDAETLQAAILNGITEVPGFEQQRLHRDFSPAVVHMVFNMARLSDLTTVMASVTVKEQREHAESLRRLLLGIADDVRAVLVVLADQLHLMRASKHLDDEVRARIARETQEIYAPLANRLGIWQIKWELEDLALRYLEPEEYMRIARLLDGRRTDREVYITHVIETLREKFTAAGIKAQITGRPKHIYSIWRKMHRKGVDFDQIFDVRAVRVLVDDITACYSALGVVHGLWRHIPGEFDDYIATPKANMYQSIHTAVVGPEDQPLEIQIRTQDMHQHAELGVAAHWRYKENTGHDTELERRILWMRHWLELKDEGGEADDFLERFKAEFEPVQIYVLTPQNKVVELPKGSTPVDFAYAIHSEVGHKCRGARVNGRIVPLNKTLGSGQRVEIITAKNGTPSRDWLNPHLGYLHTARARNRVRQWFKQQDYDQHLSDGRAAYERELTRLGVSARPDLDHLAPRYNFKKGEDLLAAIGRGEVSPVHIIGQAADLNPQRADSPEQPTTARPKSRPKSKTQPQGHGEVIVEGVGDLLTHMARCCKPVPYDPIVGFITRGRGVTVHRQNCPHMKRLSDADIARRVQVHWSGQPGNDIYPVDIHIRASDRKGLLRDISSVISNEDVDVIGVNTHSDRTNDTATMRVTVEIADMKQLSRVIGKVAQIPDVIEVRRRV